MLFQVPYIVFNYKTYIIFLVASLVVSIGIQMVLPFPYGLGVALALFIAFPFFLRRRYMGKMRGTGGSMFGMGANSEYSANRPIKYVCLVCGNQHKASNVQDVALPQEGRLKYDVTSTIN